MEKIDFKGMSNGEINIKMKVLEQEYENTKAKIFKLIKEMEDLDTLYSEGKKELINRSKGIF